MAKAIDNGTSANGGESARRAAGYVRRNTPVPPEPGRQVLTPQEAAFALNVSVRQLQHLVNAENGLKTIIVGRRIRYAQKDIDAYLKRGDSVRRSA